MLKNQGPLYYSEYLKLDQFLSSQSTESQKRGQECHDELLFIVVHQAYELWFKQILHELKAVLKVMNKDYIPEDNLFSVYSKLERIIKIQGLFGQYLEILETMTPMDFLEFRDLLIPASGFQSVQFREIEIRMGLSTSSRENVDRNYFLGRLKESDRAYLIKVESDATLITLVEKWLERLPFTNMGEFNFWAEYRAAVSKMLAADRQWMDKNPASLGELEKKIQLESYRITDETFNSLFDEKKYEEMVANKVRRFSQKATLNALFILLYRHEPMLSYPYQILNALLTIDENFTCWRFKHALMAQRMVGTKIGTGGSSGHQYLRKATDTNRIFVDLFNLSTFLIPRSELPEIPSSVRKQLSFS